MIEQIPLTLCRQKNIYKNIFILKSAEKYKYSAGARKKNNILIEKDSVLKLNVACCLKQILRKIERKISKNLG